MQHAAFFRRHPIFTVEEFAIYLSSRNAEVGERAREGILAYHRKVGRLVRVRRGLYVVIPAGADSDSYSVNPFLVTAKLTPDSVLSHHTALEFHGKAYSVHTHIIYSASSPLAHLAFRSHVFQGTKFSLALVRAGKADVGVLTMECEGMNVRVTSLERTLVDILDRPELSGSWEEIWRSLESVEFFDLDKVVEYARLLGNATTTAKVGLFLEQHRKALMVDDQYLKVLRDMRPKQPHYMSGSRRKSGRFVPEWNLVVPGEILERTWEEVK
jgi:predicted transcriptional regulator of viral defense system